MTPAFLLQTLGSLVAILLLAGLAWWAEIARPAAALDEAGARALLAEEFPDHALGAVWVSADGLTALARSGDEALIVYRSGDGHVARTAPWGTLGAATPGKGGMTLRLRDFTAPRARFALAEGAAWPPSTGLGEG